MTKHSTRIRTDGLDKATSNRQQGRQSRARQRCRPRVVGRPGAARRTQRRISQPRTACESDVHHTVSTADHVAPGTSAPLGATVAGGVNFSVYREARGRASNCCCSTPRMRRAVARDRSPTRVDIARTTTGTPSSPDVRPGQIYGYRSTDRSSPERGLRFDPTKVLLDPYGRGVVVPDELRPRGARSGRATTPRPR